MPRKILLFQVYDNAAKGVGGPIMAQYSQGPAIRAFMDVLKDPNTTPGKHPADYDLVKVGEQDEETGQISAQLPEVILKGATWQEQQQARA